jgi:hypothetical protein
MSAEYFFDDSALSIVDSWMKKGKEKFHSEVAPSKAGNVAQTILKDKN